MTQSMTQRKVKCECRYKVHHRSRSLSMIANAQPRRMELLKLMLLTPTRASSGTITKIVWVSYWTFWNLIHERVRSGRSAHSLVYLMDMVVQTALISCETTCISLWSRSHHFHRTLNKLYDEASLQLSKPSCSQLETSQVASTKVAHVLLCCWSLVAHVTASMWVTRELCWVQMLDRMWHLCPSITNLLRHMRSDEYKRAVDKYISKFI